MKVEYPYYSIQITGGLNTYSVAPADVKPVYAHCTSNGITSVYSVLQKTQQLFRFECELQNSLRKTMEEYPDDTWLSITFYGNGFNEIKTYEASCKDNFYCAEHNLYLIPCVLNFARDNLV